MQRLTALSDLNRILVGVDVTRFPAYRIRILINSQTVTTNPQSPFNLLLKQLHR